MTDVLAEGLRISAIGISLVFVALGVIVLLVLVLQRVSTWTLSREPRDADTVGPDAGEENLARVAAIAVALLRARSPRVARDPSLGRLLEDRSRATGSWEVGDGPGAGPWGTR